MVGQFAVAVVVRSEEEPTSVMCEKLLRVPSATTCYSDGLFRFLILAEMNLYGEFSSYARRFVGNYVLEKPPTR